MALLQQLPECSCAAAAADVPPGPDRRPPLQPAEGVLLVRRLRELRLARTRPAAGVTWLRIQLHRETRASGPNRCTQDVLPKLQAQGGQQPAPERNKWW